MLPGLEQRFDAVELRRAADGAHPIVTGRVARQVVAAMGRRHAWLRGNLWQG